MVFTLEEIKNYLKNQPSLECAINNLTEENIVSLIDDFSSLNFQKNNENLKKYEMSIGLYQLKEEQRTIFRNSNGHKGKNWMALSPKWIDSEKSKR